MGTNGQKFPSVEREKCIADGGTIRRIGILQNQACVFLYTDAGRECRSSSECEGRCLIENDWISVGTEVAGECERDSSEFGCWTEVESGLAVRAMCVD